MSRSNSSDEETEDLPSNFVAYSNRSEWIDVKPIPQDEGEHPIVKINYSDNFREVFDYLRACMKSNEISERALHLTFDAAKLNPANYTVWCYRRELIDKLGSDLDEELKFIGEVIRDNPKNYQVWEHRRLIIERSSNFQNELSFIAEILRSDAKNYHAWQYRQWLLRTYSLWSNEMQYIEELLASDHLNNSLWNQRYFVISHTTGFKDDVIERELDYIFREIRLCPDNESVWNYFRGITRFRSLEIEDRRVLNFCNDLYENQYKKETFQRDQWRFLLAFMIDLLNDDDRPETINQNQEKIRHISRELIEIDPIRRKYWQFILDQHPEPSN